MRYGVAFIILMSFLPLLYAAEKPLLVGDFSAFIEGQALPEYWQELIFDGLERHTEYHWLALKDKGVIQAKSQASSSGLVRKISIDTEQLPNISWRWKIDNIIHRANLRKKSGDDAPARLYITFAYDPDKVNWWERLKFKAIKLFYGEYPPINALTYIWASHLPEGTILENPYTDRVKMIVLQSGEKQQGKWLIEQRNIRADYRQAFGEADVPQISGVAIMTDTDNTGASATAWYGDIVFYNTISPKS